MEKLISAIASKIASDIVLKIYGELVNADCKEIKKSSRTPPINAWLDSECRLSYHLQKAVNWSQSTQFNGMRKPADVDTQTVGLRFSTIPRKFRDSGSSTTVDELDLITDKSNIMLLGEPGSGKTTTVKRLLRHMLSGVTSRLLIMSGSLDVFLSYNSKDKPMVRQLAKALQVRGLQVWLDEEQLVPGRPWEEALEKTIQTVRTAAVLVGQDGLGPWEIPEMRACLSEFVNRHLPVIPVLLPDAPGKPELPLFLRAFTWVDLRGGLTNEGLDRLEWGITGVKPGQSSGDTFQVPIIIRAREIEDKLSQRSISIRATIAGELGIRLESKKNGDFLVENRSIKLVIPEILDELKAVIFVDGLDESSRELREYLNKELEQLALSLSSSRIIATCRSGDYIKTIGSFRILEVCPFTDTDIEDLSAKWIPEKSDDFLKDLKDKPYLEFAKRPLFLTQIITLFYNSGYLPEWPYDIYQLVTLLLIKNWDHDRGVNRISRYAHFQPERKLEFLAHFSYELTYKTKSKQFTTKTLIEIYNTICNNFGLPKDQAEQVAQEIETHTGIIIQTGYQLYEFTHLTIQEYLCAEYLVKAPMVYQLAYNYLKQYPAPLAIATAISSDSSLWLSVVLLHLKNYGKVNLENLKALLSRLLIEKPRFSQSVYLGLCTLYLLSLCKNRIENEKYEMKNVIDGFLSLEGVRPSVQDALTLYRVEQDQNEELRLQLTRDFFNDFNVKAPDTIEISKHYLENLIEGSAITMEFLINNDEV